MIAIGGAIGTGLFLASGSAIHTAGPGGALAAYVIMGVIVYLLMTSLGEMAAYLPTSGSFYSYAERFIDPSLGFALGCNYWYSWAITVAAEIAAAGIVMKFWFPHTPPLLWSSFFLALFVFLNAFTVKLFGEAEYWMSLIKVMVIVVFILAGTSILLGLIGHHAVGLQNWHVGDAPFHGGFLTVLSAFLVAGFSFQGTEFIGVAAGESKNPAKMIPLAMRQVFWRIILFYILSIAIISFLIPYTSSHLAVGNIEQSPFTLVFQQTGISFVAGIMNAVVLVAILSAGNSGMYVSTRMLWHLAKQKHLPAIFTKLTKGGIPIYALLATTAFGLLAFLSSLFGSGKVYLWLVNTASLSGFIAWVGIAISHYRFRKAFIKQGRSLDELPYVAKGYPYAPLIAFIVCIIIIAGQNYELFTESHIQWQGIVLSYFCVPLFIVLWLGYKWTHKTKIIPLHECDFDTDNFTRIQS
jgi:lysine-specific permease